MSLFWYKNVEIHESRMQIFNEFFEDPLIYFYKIFKILK